MNYTVYVRYEGSNTYVVEASSPEEAAEKAKQLFLDGDDGIMTGSEYEDVVNIDVDKE